MGWASQPIRVRGDTVENTSPSKKETSLTPSQKVPALLPPCAAGHREAALRCRLLLPSTTGLPCCRPALPIQAQKTRGSVVSS
jgi:hypothetical protein